LMSARRSTCGIALERRLLFAVGAAAIARLARAADDDRPGAGRPSDFSTEIGRLASALSAAELSEELYVAAVAERVRRFDPAIRHTPPEEMNRFRFFRVLRFRMRAGSEFPLHDHRQYNGVLYVLDGAVRCESFSLLGRSTTPGRVLIRRDVDALLEAGQASTLTGARANIHRIRAAESGCRMLDVQTWTGPVPRSVRVALQPRPVDPNTNLFEAEYLE
jgi:hypothetical protein